jgi:hypothetical protein
MVSFVGNLLDQPGLPSQDSCVGDQGDLGDLVPTSVPPDWIEIVFWALSIHIYIYLLKVVVEGVGNRHHISHQSLLPLPPLFALKINTSFAISPLKSHVKSGAISSWLLSSSKWKT